MKILKKLKLFLLLYNAYKKIKEVVKMKFLSRKFILSLATIGFTIWLGVQGLVSPELTATTVLIAVAVYNLANAIAKITTTKKDDEFLAELKEIFTKKKK